jgi:four helix bundle protein
MNQPGFFLDARTNLGFGHQFIVQIDGRSHAYKCACSICMSQTWRNGPGETGRRVGVWADWRDLRMWFGRRAGGATAETGRRMGGSASGKHVRVVRWRWRFSLESHIPLQKHVMRCVRHFRELNVYQGAMSLVMRIFELTEHFPVEERYTLTDQVRRSSRSVCANLAEAWRRRRYQAAFVSKLNDAEAEAAETQVHVEIAYRQNYLSQEIFAELDEACDKILAQIVQMVAHADRWVIKPLGLTAKNKDPRL